MERNETKQATVIFTYHDQFYTLLFYFILFFMSQQDMLQKRHDTHDPYF